MYDLRSHYSAYSFSEPGPRSNISRLFSNVSTLAKCLHVIADHHHYVQGVAWDPLGEFVATQSSDR